MVRKPVVFRKKNTIFSFPNHLGHRIYVEHIYMSCKVQIVIIIFLTLVFNDND